VPATPVVPIGVQHVRLGAYGFVVNVASGTP
jgi:hypothetical protein